MDKRHLHHLWTNLRKVKAWYFLIGCLIFGVIGAFALRANNLHMVQLRQAVYAADESDGNVEVALQNLRSYVGAHMNTSLAAGNNIYPPIQLKYTYERLVQAAGAQSSAANANLYTDAQASCEKQVPTGFSGRYRLDCIEQYIDQHAGSAAANIPASLYKFDFVSPRWSPDLAGWSLAAAAACLFAFISWLLLGRYLRRAVK